MITTPLIANLTILVQFIVGGFVGLLIAGVVLRSKLNWRRGLTSFFVTGVVLELIVGATSWASWRQDISWTDRISAHAQFIIWTTTICISFITALIMNRLAAKQPEV
jgi:uncharacterized membrane protein